MIYLAADHAGFSLKEKIKAYLTEHQIKFNDQGAYEFDQDDDYPDFGWRAARAVAADPDKHQAILICGSGAGMAIVANKVPGVYCAQVWQRDLASTAREHDRVNCIALPARYMSEEEAVLAVAEFLKDINGEVPARHLRRFGKVKEIEKNSYGGNNSGDFGKIHFGDQN